MARLPLVEASAQEVREWLTPQEIEEAFRLQPRFVRPDVASLRWTLLSTVAPGAVFLRWVLPRALAPGQVLLDNWSCSCCSFWALGAVVAFASAACRNPGVVPRAAPRRDQLSAPPPKYVSVNGVQVRQRWCTTCKVHRPLRSKHCSYCDRCVFRFDHHCTWLGNCVGLGNYRAFLALVTAASLFFGHSMVVTFSVLRAALRAQGGLLQHGLLEALRRLFVAHATKTFYVAYSLVMFLAFLVLWLYHAIIIACNLTTNEHVRDYYLARNPYDATCPDNCRQVFCAPYGRPVRIGAEAPARAPEATSGIASASAARQPRAAGGGVQPEPELTPELNP